MIVHLYAQCWNDALMLPFFFRHYDVLVDRYFIYDDGSTDGSWELLQAHRKVDARRFSRTIPESFALSEQVFSDQCWKESRGRADWVIVIDLDEHLFHSFGRAYLTRCRSEGVTVIPALGFQMISEREPTPDNNLCLDFTMGAPWEPMMKIGIFDPAAITEINFAVGRHTSDPTGRICVPKRDELLLLHYKYMGLEQTHRRHQELRSRLGSVDIQRGWGHKYSWSVDEVRADWNEHARRAIDTRLFRQDPVDRYPVRPWWQKYRE
jgi:hypothetical protein